MRESITRFCLGVLVFSTIVSSTQLLYGCSGSKRLNSDDIHGTVTKRTVFPSAPYQPLSYTYTFVLLNKGPDLVGVNFTITLLHDDTSKTHFERYWGEWNSNEQKMFDVPINNPNSQLEGCEITLEDSDGKFLKKNRRTISIHPFIGKGSF